MKKKKIVILAVIVFGVICLATLAFFVTRKSYTLNLPEKDKIVSIDIEENGQLLYISNEEKIETIFNIISNNNKKTYKSSINDIPTKFNTLMKISFNYESDVASVIYLYTKDGAYYMEQPYNGIYRLNGEDFAKIEEYFKI